MRVFFSLENFGFNESRGYSPHEQKMHMMGATYVSLTLCLFIR